MKLNGHNYKSFKKEKMTETLLENNQRELKEVKIEKIAYHFKKIMQTLDLNMEDASIKDTPLRVAKMYVDEVFRGLDINNFPQVSFFDKDYGYDEMVVVNDITLFSYCEHHFVPFMGKVHVGYYPHKKVIGLSKLNRIVEFLSKKPQVQERLTVEIARKLSELLETEHIAVYIEANHLCVASRGIKDTNSVTKTSCYLGKFGNEEIRREFTSFFGS